MHEFKVNDLITLKLEENETHIYVAGKRFRQCKKIIFEIPIENITELKELKSIDELIDKQENRSEDLSGIITPEAEFWGHCSNIQIWVENEYETKLLHRELAFPLLLRLTDAGDLKAKSVIKKEILKRFEKNYFPVIFYLLVEDYPKYVFSEEEQSNILLNLNLNLKDKIITSLKKDIKTREKDSYAILILKILITRYNDLEAKKILKKTYINILRTESKTEFNYLLEEDAFYYMFNEKDLQKLVHNSSLLVKTMKNEKKIRDLYHSILQNLNSEKRVKLYEKLLVMVNYREDEEKIKDVIYENLFYIKGGY
jgi:hypothetical protein